MPLRFTELVHLVHYLHCILENGQESRKTEVSDLLHDRIRIHLKTTAQHTHSHIHITGMQCSHYPMAKPMQGATVGMGRE